MTCFRSVASIAVLFAVASVHAQCDPLSVDFGAESWGLSPDAETTFFDTAYVGLDYADEVHLLVPSFAIDVVPDTPLNAEIDSVVIEGVVLVDTLAGDTLTFEEAGLQYTCNNNGDCVDPCTFLGGEQYCADFSGVPVVTGNYILSLEVNVWATVFSFPLATPFSFDGFPFPILDPTSAVEAQALAQLSVYPNPVTEAFTLSGAEGAQVRMVSAQGDLLRQWNGVSARENLTCDGLANGLYFLHIQRGEGVEVRRILVQR